jgi:uncharacterized repeat protein (TIGR01451 family)
MIGDSGLTLVIRWMMRRLQSGWIFICAGLVFLLALSASPSVQARELNQTVPRPTATPTITGVPTVTATPPIAPTNTPVPGAPAPTDTPISGAPAPTDTPVPGSTPATAGTPVTTPAVTQPQAAPAIAVTPTFALSLQMSAPTMGLPGDTVEIRYTVTNPSSTVANNVTIRNLVPEELILISVESDTGDSRLENEGENRTVVILEWESLAAGQSVEATLFATILPDLAPGSVIDNLAVAFADNAAGNTAGISIGLPPALLPFFD